MNSQQRYYSPFSPSARKWMITIGSIAIAVVLVYALTTGVISYLNY
jgi:Ni/Fe-hydrogenase subunit HybB-like protein